MHECAKSKIIDIFSLFFFVSRVYFLVSSNGYPDYVSLLFKFGFIFLTNGVKCIQSITPAEKRRYFLIYQSSIFKTFRLVSRRIFNLKCPHYCSFFDLMHTFILLLFLVLTSQLFKQQTT